MRLTITSILLFLFATSLAQNENQIAQELRVRNHIKEELVYGFNLETGDSSLLKHLFYDTSGNYTMSVRYDGEENVNFKYVTWRSSDGRTSIDTGFNKYDSISNILIYEYDEDGNRVGRKQLDSTGEVLVHQKRLYNRKGQNTKLFNKLSSSNDFYLSTQFFYNKDGQYKKIKLFNSIGQIIITYEYEYNDNGLLSSTYQVKGADRILESTCVYDSQGRKIKEIYPNEINEIGGNETMFPKKPKNFEFVYDNDGNLIEERTTENDMLKKVLKFYYRKFDP